MKYLENETPESCVRARAPARHVVKIMEFKCSADAFAYIDVGINHVGNIWPDSSRSRVLLSASHRARRVCRSNKLCGSISDKLCEIWLEPVIRSNYGDTCQKLTFKNFLKLKKIFVSLEKLCVEAPRRLSAS